MSWIRHTEFYQGEYLLEEDAQPDPRVSAEPKRSVQQSYWPWWRRAASYPLIWFIMGWRKLISPLYGRVCAYYPSCSAYGLEAVSVHGLLRGTVLTSWRILRCNPFSNGGVDHVPASERAWPAEELPDIVRLNHPPIPRDPD